MASQLWLHGQGPMTLAELLREKWGDVVSLSLIFLGIIVHMYGPGEGHQLGDGLVAAGLATLRLSMPARKTG